MSYNTEIYTSGVGYNTASNYTAPLYWDEGTGGNLYEVMGKETAPNYQNIWWKDWTTPISGVGFWNGRTILYSQIGVKIKSTPLSKVTEKIPYGAKLKVLEAKKTGIFKDFVYITPEFNYEDRHRNIEFPELPSIDPAILGTTGDGRMYMIIYWDIEKDVAKVVKEIEHFKKFKLKKA